MRFQVRSLYYEFGVALMARAFTDNDPGRSQTKETAGGRSNNARTRIYRTRQVFHQIRFEENGFAGHIQAE
jgi:hypothetical protein